MASDTNVVNGATLANSASGPSTEAQGTAQGADNNDAGSQTRSGSEVDGPIPDGQRGSLADVHNVPRRRDGGRQDHQWANAEGESGVYVTPIPDNRVHQVHKGTHIDEDVQPQPWISYNPAQPPGEQWLHRSTGPRRRFMHLLNALQSRPDITLEGFKKGLLEAANVANPSWKSKKYNIVRVLLLYWDEDDLNVKNETERLQ
ncbi:MAG: hypothetical protein Q9222_002054 [Ikaeria aurantiellina]